MWQEGLHVSQQPWTYFDNISVFDQSMLRPCTGPIVDAVAGAAYVNVTGDVDGVVRGPDGAVRTLNRSLDLCSFFVSRLEFQAFLLASRKHLVTMQHFVDECPDNVDLDFSGW